METPIIQLSEAAKRAIQDAAVEAGGDLLRITVSDRFDYDLRSAECSDRTGAQLTSWLVHDNVNHDVISAIPRLHEASTNPSAATRPAG